jgi:hypothetical protein
MDRVIPSAKWASRFAIASLDLVRVVSVNPILSAVLVEEEAACIIFISFFDFASLYC